MTEADTKVLFSKRLSNASAHRSLLHRLTWLRRIRLLHQHNHRLKLRLPIAHRIAAWRHGFTYLSHLVYELHQNDPSDYLPDFVDINYRHEATYRRALSDKLSMAYFLHALGARGPKLYGYTYRGKLLQLEQEPEDGGNRRGQPTSWPELLNRRINLVLKPIDGGGGRGIRLLRWSGTDHSQGQPHQLTINGTKIEESAALPLLESLDGYLVTELVEQADFAHALFPDTPNTFRLLTLWDEESGTPFVAAATVTIGSSRSHVNNFKGGLGGYSAPIDQATGRIGMAASLDESHRRLERHTHHPETGAQIEGAVIDNWNATQETILAVAAGLPHCPFVAWDAIPTADGPVFVDANSPPGLFISQVHGGLLRDPRSRRFFQSYGMI